MHTIKNNNNKTNLPVFWSNFDFHEDYNIGNNSIFHRVYGRFPHLLVNYYKINTLNVDNNNGPNTQTKCDLIVLNSILTNFIILIIVIILYNFMCFLMFYIYYIIKL